MTETSVYSVLFFDLSARLLDQQHFTAASPRDARILGAAIFEACSDQSASYELWQGHAKLIVGLRPGRRPAVGALSEELSSLAVDIEERMASSQSAIARSRKLLEALDTFDIARTVGVASSGASGQHPAP